MTNPVNVDLALNWVEEERAKNQAMLDAIFKLMDTVLTIEMVQDYLDERIDREYAEESNHVGE